MGRAVIWPAVQAFPEPVHDKEQMHKILEEAAEVYAEWQAMEDDPDKDPVWVVNECADLMQAVTNLLASYGVSDMRDAMFRCHERNRLRGRC